MRCSAPERLEVQMRCVCFEGCSVPPCHKMEFLVRLIGRDRPGQAGGRACGSVEGAEGPGWRAQVVNEGEAMRPGRGFFQLGVLPVCDLREGDCGGIRSL